MLKLIPIQFIARLLLVMMVTLIVYGVYECAHAMQKPLSAANYSSITDAGISAPHQCPCTPPVHKDYDGCDTCINCPCHASLTIQQLVLNYNPIILNLGFFDPYQHIPVVFLSKFIPPQNLA